MRRACALDDIEEGGCLGVEIDGEPLLLHRLGDRVTALQGRCPHQGAPLAEGAIGGGLVVCPWHHAVFELESGARRHGPGLGRLRRHAAQVEKGAIWVGAALDEPPPPAPRPHGLRIVVVGAGAAGLACVDALRARGHDGPLTLIDAEDDPLYERTAMSKDVLRGAADRTAIRRIGRAELERMGVALRFGERVAAIRAETREVALESGERLAYDRCFAAPGAAARRLDLPGAELDGVRTLRSAEDAEALLGAARAAGRCVVIGGGFIGLEAAGSLAQAGVAVRLLAREAAPGAKRLGPDIAALAERALRRAGVEVTTGVEPEAFEGEDGRLARVRLSTGETLETKLALLAVGEARRGGLFAPAEGDGAVPTDDGLRVAERLWAGGDAAARAGARTRHWRAAEEEGRMAATAMLGFDRPAEAVPFFWTEIGGKDDMVGLHMAGRTDPELPYFDVGAVQENDFTRWMLDGDEVVGAIGSGARDRAAGWHLARLSRGPVRREALQAAGWDPLAMLAREAGR
jgi:NADPH-dependent 2,4-dienoyl-CoA reductase/sulfur reductase-like enzyme/nitrite reductase/ring-hydroxylating ferredoxin subunit